ncbi:murein L,D-transpeptidase catalytic domain family protein [Sphingobacterium spiritivorum]|nr:murein L,D-transpeptidase catalytic domain family protein [Sphingobacterium spiritivorum]
MYIVSIKKVLIMNIKVAGLVLFVSLTMINCQAEGDKRKVETPVAKQVQEDSSRPKVDSVKLQEKAEEALTFCKQKKFSTDFCILIDMKLHSGINRFFIWDFKNKRILEEYLVGHGCGLNNWSSDESKDKAEFSNKDGSHLSSLGKYKIGARGYSNWGINIKYILHGLEKTNDNALKRIIVFHSWEKMNDAETFPQGSPEGWGCPTVSNEAMKIIDARLRGAKKPVLMWIYN